MCGWKNKTNHKQLGFKTHLRRKNHNWYNRRACLTERKEIEKDKLEATQNKFSKIKWGDTEVSNCWQFPCLARIAVPARWRSDVRHKDEMCNGENTLRLITACLVIETAQTHTYAKRRNTPTARFTHILPESNGEKTNVQEADIEQCGCASRQWTRPPGGVPWSVTFPPTFPSEIKDLHSSQI